MEQRGENPLQKIYAVIPARFHSTRLEAKLMLPLNGKPLILHTLEQTKKAGIIDRTIVATDDARILQIVKESGNEAVLTSADHQSGSDRIAEVAEQLEENSIIVNVQGDEPLIPTSTIEKAVVSLLENEQVEVATTCEKIKSFEEVSNPNTVKVVRDKNDFALYFSRLPIPYPREIIRKYGSLKLAFESDPKIINLYRKHTGLYVYRRNFLLDFTKQKQTALEKYEMLEQLRILENGARIKCVDVPEKSIGVDTLEDFEQVKRLIESRKLTF